MEQFINLNPKTLGTAITNGTDTTITLNNVTGLPTSGNCRARIEDEYLLVTLNGTATVTVVRGIEGSTGVAHSSGLDVNFVLTNGALLQFRADNVSYGLTSSRPSAGNKGVIYHNTDSPLIALDNGSTWDLYYNNKLVTPPSPGSFTGYGTADAGSSPTVLNSSQGDCNFCYFNSTTSGTSAACGAYCLALPGSTTWRSTLGMIPSHGKDDQILLGMTLLESSSGKCLFIGYQFAGASGDMWISANFRTLSAGSSSFASDVYNQQMRNVNLLRYIRLYYDNANARVTVFISEDGIKWGNCGNIMFSGNFTSAPDKVGFGISPPQVINPGVGMDIFHWSLESGI